MSLVVASGATTSGLDINLHPLPILNISEHQTRARLTSSHSKVIGALLGTQANRQISIVNSFELIQAATNDVHMRGGVSLDDDFFITRKDQFKTVFPTLEVVGWYSIGEEPTAEDIWLHRQIAASVDTPIFVLFTSHSSRDLPIRAFEAALAEGNKENDAEGKFVELEYGIETGEAERIAVDGVSRGDLGSSSEDSAAANLTTQRNAIRMLYERIIVLHQYIDQVLNGMAKADHSILRQISALVSGLPTMDAKGFEDELSMDYGDVELTGYLTALTQQVGALGEYADTHGVVYPGAPDDFGGGLGRSSKGSGSFEPGRRRR